ncbi:MAG: CoA transferase subunit A [Hyphomonadaceae bacterium]|nr:CoA transferase subunit A [Hyphomonadaceae bacterium]
MNTRKIFSSSAEALEGVCEDGMLVACGGFGLCGMPEGLIDALLETGVGDLTVVSNNAGVDGIGLAKLIEAGRVRKMISSYIGNNRMFEQAYLNGDVELEFSPQGTMSERLRAGGAGIPAFYTRTGVGTTVAEGKPHAEFNGQTFIQERGIVADLALIRAEKADGQGNLVYRKTARNFNPVMAMSGCMTVAEVTEIVEVGTLGPDAIHTPGIFVQRIVSSEVPKRIEFTTTRQRQAS